MASLDRARLALEAATTVEEVRVLRDQAEALRTYAAAAGMGMQAQNLFADLRIRAEHRAGRLLGTIVARGGDRRPGATSRGATLASLGVNRTQSSRWQAIGQLADGDLDKFLTECIETGREITTGAVLSLVRPGGRFATTPDPPPGQNYRTVVVDPPWPFRKQSARGATGRHYPAMDLDCIQALPVSEWAGPDAHLYLWTTNAHLPDALRVVQHWGWKYRTLVSWAKPGIGVGTWYRGTTEHIIFATRGTLPTLQRNKGTWFEAPRGRHSAKPAAAYELIESMSPGPRLELFARATRPGWDAWGDEVGLGSGS